MEPVVNSSKVLLVDDDVHILDSLKRQLNRVFSLDTATCGFDALTKIAAKGPYAVVVTDLSMPEMDGIELLEKVREISPDTVRIILTGYADRDKVIEAINSGYVFRFLDKPCTGESLRTAIEQGLQQYQQVLAVRELHMVRHQKMALEKVVMGFSRLVEARDPYTAGHQKRVAQLAVAIAGQLELSDEVTDSIRIAAMVHDIGKIYVPAEFLNKPGKLSKAEFQIIQAHPKVGWEILSPMESEWSVSEFVYEHHERMDGSGYPRGLRGGEIALEARVISVSDVVEAIQSHRPYRPALGIDKAMEEITDHQSTRYDKEVVLACRRVFKTVRRQSV